MAVAKMISGAGSFKKICKDACRVAGAIQETSPSHMFGGQGVGFLRGVAFGTSILRSAKIILRDSCSTSDDLASLFRGRRQAQYFRDIDGKIAKRIGTRLSGLHNSPF